MNIRWRITWIMGAFILAFWSQGASAACMSRNFDNVAQVPADQRGKPHQVLVAEEDVAAFEERGFSRAVCAGAISDRASQFAFRNAMCQLVAGSNILVQRQAEKALGAPPALLCESAQKLLGAWDGEPGPSPPAALSNSGGRAVDAESASLRNDMRTEEGEAK